MDVRNTRYQKLANYLANVIDDEGQTDLLAQGIYDYQAEQTQDIKTKYAGDDAGDLVRVSLPMDLYNRLMATIAYRVLHLVGEHHPKRNKVGSERELFRAIKQAKQEALREALEDWLQKPKDEKWF